MPTRPKKPCARTGCPELVEAGQRYCQEHTRNHNRYVKQNRTDKEEQKLYDSTAWKRLRRLKLSINPLCERCEKDGLTVIATIVHHIEEIREGGRWLPTIEELESLCKSCHSREHAPSLHRQRPG